jgi:hypothetical protein
LADGLFSYPKSQFGYILEDLGMEIVGTLMTIRNSLWPLGVVYGRLVQFGVFGIFILTTLNYTLNFYNIASVFLLLSFTAWALFVNFIKGQPRSLTGDLRIFLGFCIWLILIDRTRLTAINRSLTDVNGAK